MTQHAPWKPSLATIAALFALGNASVAMAHSQQQSLGTARGATDLYVVNCSTDSGGVTDHLKVTIKDLPPKAAPWVSVQVIKDKLARNATDPVDGDAIASGATVTRGGNGPYLVVVGKSSAGAEYYALDFHCEALNGNHTGTTIGNIQDQ